MINNLISKIIAISLLALLSACAKEPPKCSDDKTESLILSIISEQIGKIDDLPEKEMKLKIKLEYPRATTFDQNIKKFTCEAKLIVANNYKLPIIYESQLDDNNQHLVSLNGISEIDLYNIKAALSNTVANSTENTTPQAKSNADPIPNADTNEVSDLPSFKEYENYASVREKMLAANWLPFHAETADECSETDTRCKDRPEMESCAGTGMGNCKFLWKKNGKTTGICTVDGDPAVFANFCSD